LEEKHERRKEEGEKAYRAIFGEKDPPPPPEWYALWKGK